MATPSIITSHVVVEFGDPSAAANAILEVDDRPAGLNGGKTSFYPGDNVGLLLFIPEGYAVTGYYTTAGSIAPLGSSTKDVELFPEFPNEDTATLNYPMPLAITSSFIGNVPSGTTLSRTSENTVQLSARPIDAITGKPIPEYRLAVAKVNYASVCGQYRLESVPVGVSKVMVLFVISKVITP